MKKIMFSDKFGLTEAVLSGRKTQTRRIVKFSDVDAKYLYDEEWNVGGYVLETIIDRYARYKVGEVVAVAQRYRDFILNPISIPADMGWFNKMFVRADLMPHQIRITNVRVEKLQDIGDVDCLAEGIEFSHKAQSFYVKNDYTTGTQTWLGNTPREAYAALIDHISGKGMWQSNPYVFVYEFELIK